MTHHVTTRRWSLPTYISYTEDIEVNKHWEYDHTSTLSSLQQFISRQFNIKHFELRYVNKQGPPITIVKDEDLNEAFNCAQNENRDTLQILVNDEVARHFPLCQFTTNDMCGTLKQSFHNDPKHTANITKMQNIFTRHELSGKKWIESNDVKDVEDAIKVQMLEFMTKATFDIIFQWFDDSRDIKSLSAKQMARIMYQYPLKHLMTALRKDSIDGQHINEILDDNKYIQTHTGWSDEKIHEIKRDLLGFWTFTKDQFIENMNYILFGRSQTNSSSKMTTDAIKHVLVESNHDVEQIHFDIKNNRNIQYFSDIMMDMVHKIVQQHHEELKEDEIDCDLVHNIYETVARCFTVQAASSLNWSSVFQLSDCTHEHIAYIVDKYILNTIDNTTLSKHRAKIIECIQTNQINGKQLHDQT
eukprot:801832_1